MKTQLELIKNYPIEALKNWGDYFGYPEAVCKNMVDMVDVADWQNVKIAVLDDFGFQMINYLMSSKKVPLQNIYFLVSEKDEVKVELMKNWYSNFLENTILQTYNIDMSFDLIIANPPYGKGNSLAKKIIKNVLPFADSAIFLVPKNTYREETIWKKVENVEVLSNNPFPEVQVEKLSIARLSEKANNKDSYERLCLTDKQYLLLQAVRSYNVSHESHWCSIRLFQDKSMFDAANDVNVPDYLKPIFNESVISFRKKHNIFCITGWTPSSGVHLVSGADRVYNIEEKWLDEWEKSKPVGAFCFLNKLERDNFRDWWYKAGLSNDLLSLIRDTRGGDGGHYREYFPSLDWSHPWTDKEILKEIGLPEDFLEETK